MRLIKGFKFNKIIGTEFGQSFEVDKDGLYLLEISARCKNWIQNWGRLFDDDDLTISLDGRDLSGVKRKRSFEKPKAGWNGNQLKNLSQVNIFVLRLDAGEHYLIFKPDQRPELEFLRIYEVSDPSKVEFVPRSPHDQAEDGNRRPWYTFALIDLALEGLTITAKAFSGKQHLLFQSDDDDLQIKINGKRQLNNTPKSHKYWSWCGKILQGDSRTFAKELNLPSGTHYIELFADRTPTLEEVVFEFGRAMPAGPIGKVRLYRDITDLDRVHLWKNASAESEALAEVFDGDEIEIIEERVKGSYVQDKSNIWHKVEVNGQVGYILSSFVEIEGQERGVVIGKIRQKAAKLGVDVNNMLALAGCESRYKPYAVSEDGAKGVFQLTEIAIRQLKNLDFGIDDPFGTDQNIEGGIRYFGWLFETYYKDVPQPLEKTVAAYNWGQGHVPPDKPLNLENLPEETARLVTCVVENKKRRNWKQIFLPLFIFLFIFVAGISYSYLDWIDFFEPVVPEVLSQQTPEDSLANVEQCPSLVEEGNRTVVLLASNCAVVKQFDVEDLRVKDIFDLEEEEILKTWFMLHSGYSVIQDSKDNFYFLVSNTYFCGVQNCTYVLYKYNAERDTLDIINDDIFGMIVELYISPDSKKIAIVSTTHASVCDNRSYLDLLDLASKEKQRIDKFQDPELEVTHINDVSWLSGERMELSTTHSAGCDPKVGIVRHKKFFYDLETGEVESELLGERYVSRG